MQIYNYFYYKLLTVLLFFFINYIESYISYKFSIFICNLYFLFFLNQFYLNYELIILKYCTRVYFHCFSQLFLTFVLSLVFSPPKQQYNINSSICLGALLKEMLRQILTVISPQYIYNNYNIKYIYLEV